MSSIPPNIAGAILQAQVSAAETAKAADAQRNKRVRDSRQLARLADQQQHEVEDTDHTENVRVNPEDQRRRDGQDARDTYEGHARREAEERDSARKPPVKVTPSPPLPEKPPPTLADDHVDLSA
jgi:hypothetical protein